MSQQIVDGLEAWRKAAEKLSEETFLAIYGAPALQAALGVDTGLGAAAAQGGEEPAPRARWSRRRIAELRRDDDRRRAARGAGPGAALCRHGARTPSTSAASRRSAGSATRIRRSRQMTLADFKALVREQFFMLLIDEEAALAAIPACCRTRSRSAARPSRRCARCSARAARSSDARDRAARPGRGAVRPRHRAGGLGAARRGHRSQGILSRRPMCPIPRRRPRNTTA